jgi:hypothetical protein
MYVSNSTQRQELPIHDNLERQLTMAKLGRNILDE